MFKRFKEKNEQNLTIAEACEIFCKRCLTKREFEDWISMARNIDKIKNLELKLTDLKKFSREVSDKCDSLNKIVEYGKYTLALATTMNYLRKSYYRSKLKYSEEEYFVLLDFWRCLQVKRYKLEKELNTEKDEIKKDWIWKTI